ncbi:hypothetical protein HCN44_000483 [Aphidius gifuensis]|uniref:Uncharacterized protein n=1 Tax=Aphidius gifuensis TaxID=684658 RepID=A0A835CQY0_APHGI|nr:hypothetical protein HCN44_000483 [Aphidius gifuensis]
MEKIKIPLYKVLLMGDSGVGKTCILDSFLCDSFIENHDSTIGVDYKTKIIEIKEKIVKLQIWDTAGKQIIRFMTITSSYFNNVHGIVLVYDITDEESFNNLDYWLRLINDCARNDVKKILIGAKCDLKNDRRVTKKRGEQLAEKHNMTFLETSSKLDINNEEAFYLLAEDICNNTQNILCGADSKSKTWKSSSESIDVIYPCAFKCSIL